MEITVKYEGVNLMKPNSKKTLLIDYDPDMAGEYSLTKNIKPINKIYETTKTIFWWACKTCGHEWRASPIERVDADKGQCPNCQKLFNFKVNLLFFSFTLAEEEYLGAAELHKVKCDRGHLSEKSPIMIAQQIKRGNRITKCRVCQKEGRYHKEIYKSVQDVIGAIEALSISSKKEYVERCNEDSKLPHDLTGHFPELKGYFPKK